jgi:hypothetical protein
MDGPDVLSKRRPPPASSSFFNPGSAPAGFVRDGVIAGLASAAIAPHHPEHVAEVQFYLDSVVRGAGSRGAADPLYRVLAEQAAVCHIRILTLQSQSAAASSPEESVLYTAAAAKLVCELRLLILAIKQYREPLAKPHAPAARHQTPALAAADSPRPPRLPHASGPAAPGSRDGTGEAGGPHEPAAPSAARNPKSRAAASEPLAEENSDATGRPSATKPGADDARRSIPGTRRRRASKSAASRAAD